MFDFVNMMGNYDTRKIDRYEKDGLIISTAMVTDSEWGYETAVSHPSYNNENWIIVEGYDNRDVAEKGHQKWVDKMTADELPKEVKDISTASIVMLGLDLGMDVRETHKKEN